MKPHALLLALLLQLLSLITWARPDDCPEHALDGQAECIPAQFTPWSHATCEDWPPFCAHSLLWCEIHGGVWQNCDLGCVGTTIPIPSPVDNVYDLSRAFALRKYYLTCHLDPASDTGWGATVSSANCFTGSTRYEHGIEIESYREMTFTGLQPGGDPPTCSARWDLRFIAIRNRRLTCPEGFTLVRDRCKRKLEACPVGNPTAPGTGGKRLREEDYRNQGLQPLAFTRHFDSYGYYRPTLGAAGGPGMLGEYWRSNYDRRIYPVSGNPYVMAFAHRADGSVQAFNVSGADMSLQGRYRERLESIAGGFRLRNSDDEVELYDVSGKLTSITTRTALTQTLTYNALNQLERISDNFGRSLIFTYNAQGFIETMTDPASQIYRYSYDSRGNLSQVIYPGGRMRVYLYEDSRFPAFLTGIIDENDARFATYQYDAQGRVLLTEHAGGANRYSFSNYSGSSTTVTDPLGTARSYSFSTTHGRVDLAGVSQPCPTCGGQSAQAMSYDAGGNIRSKTDFRNVVTEYQYDTARNLETSRTEARSRPEQRVITTAWHPSFRLPTQIDEPGRQTTLNYDPANGNLLGKTVRDTALARSRSWTHTYTTYGRPQTMDGPRSDVADLTTYTYFPDGDACIGCRGQVRTITNALNHVTTFVSYDAHGRPTEIHDPNAVVTTLTYTPRGWLRSRTVAGEITTYDYDDVGQIVKVTAPDGSFIRYQYDAAHRLTEITDRLGNLIQYTLDPMGNRLKEEVYDPTDGLRGTMQREYDALNRLKKEIGAYPGEVTTYDYDPNSNLQRVTDPRSFITLYDYDNLNRLERMTAADTGLTQYGYDPLDQLIRVTDPRSLPTNYQIDALGNRTQLSSPDTGSSTYTPDSAGNVRSMSDARPVTTNMSYDALNRMTQSSGGGVTVDYQYDLGINGKGRLTRITDPSGNTQFFYDGLGRVIRKVQTVGGRVFTVQYAYTNGLLTAIIYPSGNALAPGYNAQGQIISLTVNGQPILNNAHYFPFGGVEFFTFGNGQDYLRTHDLNRRISSISLPITDPNTTVDYDRVNRVERFLSPAPTQSFTYDRVGNRQTQTIGAATTTYTYPPTSNRLTTLTGAQTRTYQFDPIGNVINDGSFVFGYDGRARLTSVTGAASATYQINGLGQRVAKTVSGVTTYFVYDEQGQLLGEYDNAGNLIQETVWLGTQPVATLRPRTGGIDIYFVYADHLNTPRAITDNLNRVRWRWDYTDLFGNNAATENPSGLGTFNYNPRFPGQYFDAETGNHYNYFRDCYDPQTGRYCQSDPIGLAGGISTFTYAKSNPLQYIDPFGLEAVHPPIVIPPIERPWGIGIPWGEIGRGFGRCLGAGLSLLIYSSDGGGACADDPRQEREECKKEDCEREWREARRICRELIYEQMQQRAGRRKKRSVTGVTGGYTDVEECARGLVSERCGGNKVGR